MHDGHLHAVDPAVVEAVAREQWGLDNVELVTVGVDVGSSTSHLMFSRVHLRREAQSLSSRFVVAGRTTLWRSPIVLTPYTDDDVIDAGALGRFVAACYRKAGLARADVDSGAVILTGVAITRRNARELAELFADEAGRFVCASAGHHLECALAAHGSGAVALSETLERPLLHLDVGGGTSKLALLHRGEVLQTAAIAVGGRLVALVNEVAVRVEEPAAAAAERLGIDLAPGAPMPAAARGELVEALADALAEAVGGEVRSALAEALLVTEAPSWSVEPAALSISGGVAEYVFGREERRFGDLAPELAAAIRERLDDGRLPLPLVEPAHGIRATVIGASQFSVQLSGNTVSVDPRAELPVHGLPVLCPHVEPGSGADEIAAAIVDAARRLDGPDRVALAFAWREEPSHARLRALADGIVEAGARGVPYGETLVVLLDGDVARSLGRVLRDETGLELPLVCLDGLELRAFDYVDVGARIEPAGVVPVVIKSLLFAPAAEPLHSPGERYVADER